MPKKNHPAPFAITIARDEDRTYYFGDREELNDFIRGLLVGEDEERRTPTDFKLYRKATNAWWKWEEQDFDPYDYFQDIDDDMPFAPAHKELFASFGEDIDHKILWDIAQGNPDPIVLIPESHLRQQVKRTYKSLHQAGVWDAPEFDDDEDELVILLDEI